MLPATAAGICLAAGLPAGPAAPELTLTWDAPSECPSAESVAAEFATLLGGPTRPPTTARLTAHAQVARVGPDIWTITLSTLLDDVQGERRLEGHSCQSVASAAALILALTLDPTAAERLKPGPPAPPPPDPPGLVARAPAPPGPTAPDRFFLRAFAGGATALLPTPAFTAGAGAGLLGPRWDLETFLLISAEARGAPASLQGAGGDFRLFLLAARGCAHQPVGGFAAKFCAGVAAEHLTARGFGVPDPGSGQVTLPAGLASLVLARRISERGELSLEVDATAGLDRPRFVLRNVGTVFSVPAFSLIVGGAWSQRF